MRFAASLASVKHLLEWLDAVRLLLGGVGSVATALVVTFALNDLPHAQLVATVGVAVVVGVVVLIYRTVWKPAPAPAGPQARGILGGLRPIERAPLPLRETDAQSVFDMVTGLDFRSGVLFGKPGCGKTSLIRAELLPRLAAAGYRHVYLPGTGVDLLPMTRAAIVGQLAPGAVAADAGPRDLLRILSAEQHVPVILVYDQFDDFLLAPGDLGRRTKFADWVRKCINDPSLKVRFLFVMRDDLFARLPELLPTLPAASSIAHRYELHDFSPEDAANVLELVVKQGEARFEPSLLAELVSDLSYHGTVSAALLQIVATHLKRWRIATLRRYREDGEAASILEGYVVDRVRGAGDPVVARTLLKRIAQGASGQSGGGESLERLQAAVDALPVPVGAADAAHREARRRPVGPLLDHLASARLVLRNADGTYAVPHPILQPSVVSALERLEAEADPEIQEAAALLHRYVTAFRADARTRIPPRDLRRIQRDAPLNERRQEPARTLLRKSELAVRLTLATAAGAASLVTLALGLVGLGVLVLRYTWAGPIDIVVPTPDGWSARTPSAVAFHPQSNRLAVAYPPETSRLFSLSYRPGGLTWLHELFGATPDDPIEVSGAAFTALAFHPKGIALATGDRTGEIRIWKSDLRDSDPLRDTKRAARGEPCPERPVEYLSYGTSELRLVAAGQCGAVQVWDMGAWKLLASRDLPPGVAAKSVRASANGNLVALLLPPAELPGIGTTDQFALTRTIAVWKLQDDHLVDVPGGRVTVTSLGTIGLGFDDKNRLVVATAEQDGIKLRTYDPRDWAHPKVEDLGPVETDALSDALMSGDAKVIVVTDVNSVVWIWRGADRTRPETLTPGEWGDTYLSPNGAALVLTRPSTSALFAYGFQLLNLPKL